MNTLRACFKSPCTSLDRAEKRTRTNRSFGEHAPRLRSGMRVQTQTRPARSLSLAGSRLAVQGLLKHALTFVLFAFLLLSAGIASAQQQLEVIQLRYRTADQIIPQIDPFVESGGALSGQNNQLFLRATDANRAQIKEIIAAIDRPLRRLMITVKQDSDSRDAERSAEVFGGARIGDNVRIIRPGSDDGRGVTIEQRRGDDAVQARIHGGNSNASGRVSQQVQVIEGGRAFISVGHSLPVPLRSVVLTPRGTIVSDEVVYRDIGTGFYAAPRLSDNMVTLEISPTQETPGRFGSGSVETQRLSTTVSARLGEWIELGGANQDLSRDRSGTLNYSSRDSVNTRRVLLKVEELP
jgi:type II secretory pathway component GspD/PulD (secretin)